MDTIAHFVGDERALEFFDDFFAWRKVDNRQCVRRTLQPIKMFVQFKDAAVVESKSFPNRVAALDRRVERADSSFVAVDELTVNVNDQVTVLGAKFLKHSFFLSFRAERGISHLHVRLRKPS